MSSRSLGEVGINTKNYLVDIRDYETFYHLRLLWLEFSFFLVIYLQRTYLYTQISLRFCSIRNRERNWRHAGCGYSIRRDWLVIWRLVNHLPALIGRVFPMRLIIYPPSTIFCMVLMVELHAYLFGCQSSVRSLGIVSVRSRQIGFTGLHHLI